MHKTGSSAIQRFLSRNRWALGKLGISYPASFGPDGARQPKHNAIFSAISHEADRKAPHPDLGASAPLIERTIEDMLRTRPKVAILSAEGFSGERPIFARALRPLAEHFDVQVVAFLRRRDLWVESFYKQMVQSRDVAEARAFHEFLDTKATRRHMDYLTILNWWAEAFGSDAVTVTPFEAGAGEPVHLFLKAAKLPRRLLWLPYSKGAVNVSLSAEATELLRLARQRGAQPDKATLAALDARLTPRQGAYLTAGERARLNDPFSADDREILRRFTDGGRDTLFAMEAGPSRQETWQGFPPDDPRLNHLADLLS